MIKNRGTILLKGDRWWLLFLEGIELLPSLLTYKACWLFSINFVLCYLWTQGWRVDEQKAGQTAKQRETKGVKWLRREGRKSLKLTFSMQESSEKQFPPFKKRYWLCWVSKLICFPVVWRLTYGQRGPTDQVTWLHSLSLYICSELFIGS